MKKKRKRRQCQLIVSINFDAATRHSSGVYFNIRWNLREHEHIYTYMHACKKDAVASQGVLLLKEHFS